jgi:hypothetical protein
VAFSPDERVWRNVLPPRRELEFGRKLPLAYVLRTYAAITTGSERTVPGRFAGAVRRIWWCNWEERPGRRISHACRRAENTLPTRQLPIMRIIKSYL